MFTNSPSIAKNDAPSKAPVQDAAPSAQQPLQAEYLASANKFNAMPTLAKNAKPDGALGDLVKSTDYGFKALASSSEKPPEPTKLINKPETAAKTVQDGKSTYLVLTDAYSDAAKLAADKKVFA